MITIDNKAVTGVYVGNKIVTRIFVGDRLVYDTWTDPVLVNGILEIPQAYNAVQISDELSIE